MNAGTMPTRMPRTPSARFAVKSVRTSWLVQSSASRPAMALHASAASSTERANGPTWSSELPKATTPYRLTTPYVGFTATVPQKLPGWRMEPPVSEPSAMVASPAATAAALPPDEPPGTRSRSQGFLLGPNALVSVEEPNANSSMLSLPSGMPPASMARATHVAV